MGLIDAISNALGNAYARQTKHTIEPAVFNEHSLIVPGEDENGNEWYGELTNGSFIVVPNNTFAIILDHDAVEGWIEKPGKYVFEDGVCSIFNGDGFNQSIVNRAQLKLEFNGKEVDQKRIIYVNLKDIRNIKFGTLNPILYNDPLYPSDLEIVVCGSFSIRINDPMKFYTEFVPLSLSRLSADDERTKNELVEIVLQAIVTTITRLFGGQSIRELSSCANEIRNAIMDNDEQVFYWKRNYGFSLTNLVIENIGYSDKTTKMLDLAYASKMQFERTQETINIRQRASMSFNNQVDAVLQLEKLKNMGILTESEFQKKKKEILGL